MNLLQRIKQKLEQALPGAVVAIKNEASQHFGHNPGGAHVGVTVKYAGFNGKTVVEQHQIIYKVLAEEMKKEIHSLQIKTLVE